jgi:peptide/nickel transport system ATP-binding protein
VTYNDGWREGRSLGSAEQAGPLLRVRGLSVDFALRRGRVGAVRGIDFELAAGECLAIVGESGSGKSVTARALVGLAGATARVRADELCLAGRDLTALHDREWRELRGRQVGLILQDALTALDPLRRVEKEIAEPLRNHRLVPRPGLRRRVEELLADVQVPEPGLRASQYPYQLSGGLRQRALIASAIAADPVLLVADEPTTALDVTVQAQILDLLAVRKLAGAALLLISHDLSVVARLADRIAVMYAGRIVEEGPADELLAGARHPYTRELLAAVPGTHARGTRLSGRPGQAGAPAATDGCGYAARCPLATDRCRAEQPARAELGAGHGAWCLRLDEALPAPVVRATGRGRAPGEALVEVEEVVKGFRGPDGVVRTAVDRVSFTIRAGETVGLLGESGSGKSTTAQLLLGLLEPDSGEIRVLGRPWSRQPESRRRPYRRRIQFVPQDPLSAFDPRYTVQRIVGESLGAPGRWSSRRRADRILELLRMVGLDERMLGRRPQELSGGQRQRVAIARAIGPEPALLVCDEPVSALDVSIQAQILDLFTDLREELGLALLFISHDLGVIYHTSDRVLVMRDGQLVEQGPVEDVFRAPVHPYTRELLAAVPRAQDLTGR